MHRNNNGINNNSTIAVYFIMGKAAVAIRDRVAMAEIRGFLKSLNDKKNITAAESIIIMYENPNSACIALIENILAVQPVNAEYTTKYEGKAPTMFEESRGLPPYLTWLVWLS